MLSKYRIQAFANAASRKKSFNAACHQQVSAKTQRNKQRFLYRLTTERV
jgi:hypothetical protein